MPIKKPTWFDVFGACVVVFICALYIGYAWGNHDRTKAESGQPAGKTIAYKLGEWIPERPEKQGWVQTDIKPDEGKQVLAIDKDGKPWVATIINGDWAVRMPPRFEMDFRGEITIGRVDMTSDRQWQTRPRPDIIEWRELP